MLLTWRHPAALLFTHQHLERFGQTTKPCPICDNRSWSAGIVTVAAEYTELGPNLGGESIPKVQLICNTCGFVREFAWLFITEKAACGG